MISKQRVLCCRPFVIANDTGVGRLCGGSHVKIPETGDKGHVKTPEIGHGDH